MTVASCYSRDRFTCVRQRVDVGIEPNRVLITTGNDYANAFFAHLTSGCKPNVDIVASDSVDHPDERLYAATSATTIATAHCSTVIDWPGAVITQDCVSPGQFAADSATKRRPPEHPSQRCDNTRSYAAHCAAWARV